MVLVLVLSLLAVACAVAIGGLVGLNLAGALAGITAPIAYNCWRDHQDGRR